MPYHISARDYLSRARKNLSSSDSAGLFYAAFELRAGVEARLSEYLEAQKHVSKKLKKGWQIAVLGRGIDRTFRLGDKLARFGYCERESEEEKFIFYYTPVSKRLRRSAERLGDYLHRQKRYYPDDNEWWSEFRARLERTAGLLEESCTGTMLGPPLVKPGTTQVETVMEMGIDGCPDDIVDQLKSIGHFVANISYPSKFPGSFESNAYVWRGGG